MTDSPISTWYAEQLKALMQRHALTPVEIERRTASDGRGLPVSQVTVRRILKAEARTAPERATLERIAACANEPASLAFPPPSEHVQTFSAMASNALDGAPETSARVALLIVDERAPENEVDAAMAALADDVAKWLKARRRKRAR